MKFKTAPPDASATRPCVRTVNVYQANTSVTGTTIVKTIPMKRTVVS